MDDDKKAYEAFKGFRQRAINKYKEHQAKIKDTANKVEQKEKEKEEKEVSTKCVVI